MHIFISYAKRDTYDLAVRLREELAGLPGVTAWMDESLETGASWLEQIDREIFKCDYFVVLLSPDVNRGSSTNQLPSYVIKEILKAQTLNKHIIPILVEQTHPPTLPPTAIIDLQYIDFTKDESAGIQKLLAQVKESLLKAAADQPVSLPPGPEPVKPSPGEPEPPPVATPDQQSTPVTTSSAGVAVQPRYDEYNRYRVSRGRGTTSPVANLIAWSPIGWLRLLWWLLIDPAAYKDAVLKPTDAVLASTLAWLPLWIIALGAVLSTLPFDSARTFSLVPAAWCLMITVGWLVTIIIDAYKLLPAGAEWVIVVVFFVVTCMAFFVTSGITAVVTVIAATGVAGIAAVGAALGIMAGVALGVALDVTSAAVGVAPGIAAGMALNMALVVAGNATGGVALAAANTVVMIIAIVVMIGVVFALATSVMGGLATSEVRPWSCLAFVLAFVATVVVVMSGVLESIVGSVTAVAVPGAAAVVAVGVVAVVVAGVTVGVATVIDSGINYRKSTFWGYIILPALLIAYLVLIYLCLLGGFRTIA